jgi:hypothetical protein
MTLIRAIFVLTLLFEMSYSQYYSGGVFVVQHAGSTGFFSAGYSFSTKRNNEIGLSYGFTPETNGPLHTITLKLTISTFKIPLIPNVDLFPLNIGAFGSVTFNKNLSLKWADVYPKDYYWWYPNFRQHAFVSSQVNIKVNKRNLNRIGFYIEANSNDLYLLSYVMNRKTLKFHEVFFLGAGVKLYR